MPPRRSVRPRFRPVKLVFWLNLAALLGLGGLYLVQPTSRQAEVRLLLGNALASDKRVEPLDVVRDIWTLYYGDELVAVRRPGVEANAALFAGGARPEDGGPTIRVLTNAGYVVGYGEAHRSPLWVAYRMWDLPAIPEPPPRPERFVEDPRTLARVRPADYAGSGYDRGHLAPNFAIATRFGARGQEETFLMSNVIPQRHALNAGPWRELELRVATSYPARFREVWVLAGPVFGTDPKRLRSGVPVPEACWMVVVDEHEGRVRTLGFLFPQDAPAESPLERYLTNVDRIEALTGLDLLPDLPDAAEAVIEARTAARVW